MFHRIIKKARIVDQQRENLSLMLANIAELNYYTLDQFKKRLYVEKRRAERLNTLSSMIIFDLAIDGPLFIRTSDLEKLVRLICANVRESDGVSLYNENKILVLLPDTNNDDAQYVSNNLMRQLDSVSYNSRQLPREAALKINVEIISFPEKAVNNELSARNINLLTNEVHLKSAPQMSTRFRVINKHSINFTKSSYENLNLCVASQQISTIALPMANNLLFQQEMLPNFVHFASKVIKRATDIFVSLSLLLLLSPMLLLLSLIIKLTSKGSVLFSQTRIGYKGKEFRFIKFRSMYADSDTKVHQAYMEKLIKGKTLEINNGSQENPHYKIKDDPRITPIGKILRKTSLDELPQLWNVLMGDMSLVGPRPPIPYEVKIYENWHYRRILDVKPGVTGLWQVSGRNKTTFNEMVRLDINYVENWSLLLDLKILLKTAKAVFFAEGN